MIVVIALVARKINEEVEHNKSHDLSEYQSICPPTNNSVPISSSLISLALSVMTKQVSQFFNRKLPLRTTLQTSTDCLFRHIFLRLFCWCRFWLLCLFRLLWNDDLFSCGNLFVCLGGDLVVSWSRMINEVAGGQEHKRPGEEVWELSIEYSLRIRN